MHPLVLDRDKIGLITHQCGVSPGQEALAEMEKRVQSRDTRRQVGLAL